MGKLLIVIDPQYDFIEGGKLAVKGAEDKMSALADYIANHGTDYEAIIFTSDWHPYNHCSFKENGGVWPRHCVMHSEGAAIFEPLLNASYGVLDAKDIEILVKGVNADEEEYSGFSQTLHILHLNNAITKKHINQIDVCGIAGDVCVLNSLKDLEDYVAKTATHVKLNVLLPFTASIDDGTTLLNYLKEHNIAYAE